MPSFFVRLLLPSVLLITPALLLADEPKSDPSDFYNLSLAELAQIEISIATGNSTPIDKAPATASVIYAADIEAMGAKTLDEVLETVPGLHVSPSALSRLDSVYSIRGIHTGFNPQVLLLMNGIPVQFSVQGSRPVMFRLPVASIDRVEVIRGPGSAIYGADAYAGVINVITKDAASTEGAVVGIGAGSFNSRNLWVQSATSWNNWGIAFNMAYQESDGDNSRRVNADLQTTLDTAFGTQASRAPAALSTRYKVLDTHLSLNSNDLQINLWSWLSRDAGIGAGAAQALDPEGSDESTLFLTDLTYRLPNSSEQWEHSLRLSYLHYDENAQFTLFPAGATLPVSSDGNINFEDPNARIVQFTDGLIGNPGGQSKDSQVDFISSYTGFDSHRIRFATGVRHQTLTVRESKNYGPGVIDGTQAVVDGSLTNVSGTEFIFLSNNSRTSRYISLQDEWQLATHLIATTGVRYDDYSDFGDTVNPRVALVWITNDKLTTKLLYGSAFRAPSYSELGYKYNPVSVGNPKLKPEHIDTLELSFSYRINNDLQTSLTLFDYQAKDMIEFVRDLDVTTSTAQNARDQDGQGFELESNWEPNPLWRLSGSYSYQDAKDSKTRAAVPDAPKQQIKLHASWEFKPNWLLTSQLNWVGDRQRASADPRPDIADYALINMTLRRNNVLPDLDLTLALRNITNEDAREPSNGSIPDDYPMESRSGWLEVKYRFQ